MFYEARGEWDTAASVYDDILAKSPAHEGAQKRKIALLRCARGARVRRANPLQRSRGSGRASHHAGRKASWRRRRRHW